MKPKGHSPAVELAIKAIRSRLDQKAWQPGERIPPMRTLAQMTGVSVGTMCRAISLLKAEGLIVARERRRIRVPGGRTPDAPATDPGLKWQQIRKMIEGDILSGEFGYRGKLPLFKEMQSRYDVCFATMRKILDALARDRVIRPGGTGYFLPPGRSSESGRTILFITSINHSSQRSALNHEHNRIVNMIENECIQMGLRLEVLEMDFFDYAGSRRAMAALAASRDTILGYVLDVWWYSPEEYRRAYTETLSRLSKFLKPTAIIDELGLFELPAQFISNRLLQVYRVEGTMAGKRMARLLLSRGHRSIVYISLFHHTSWSRERYEGVSEQFLGSGYAPVALVADSVDVFLPNLLTASGLRDNDVRRLITIDRTEAQIADMMRAWSTFKAGTKSSIAEYPHLDDVTSKRVAELVALSKKGANDPLLIGAYRGVLDAIEKIMFTMRVKPLLNAALENRSATAWIGSSDNVAFEALSFLRERDIDVPRRISVAGFDNVPVESLDRGLTTFDFNATGFVRRILTFILRPPRARADYRHATVEVEGMVIERRTTKK